MIRNKIKSLLLDEVAIHYALKVMTDLTEEERKFLEAAKREHLGLTEEAQPAKKFEFAIQPPKPVAKKPENFTPYDSNNPTIKSLSTAFDEAIAHHLSLSDEERAANSRRAEVVVGGHIGMKNTLLGKNAKLLKSEKGKGTEEPISLPDGRTIETTGLALAPAYEKSKFNTCPNHHSCKAECLGKTSGNYFKVGGGSNLEEFKGPRLNSLKKTTAMIENPHEFAVKLHDEISKAKGQAAVNNSHLGVRLNVLSDINPRVHKSIIEAHPDVTFYDYTKNNTDPIASNHHYTYSSTGASQEGVENPHTNWKSMRRRLDGGDNVAMAFTHKRHLPEFVHDQETGKKYKVVDGDSHDFRPLDIQGSGKDGVVIGLKNKKATGAMDAAHIDSKGFFVKYDPQLKKTLNDKGKEVYAKDEQGKEIPQNKEAVIPVQKRSINLVTESEEMEEKIDTRQELEPEDFYSQFHNVGKHHDSETEETLDKEHLQDGEEYEEKEEEMK